MPTSAQVAPRASALVAVEPDASSRSFGAPATVPVAVVVAAFNSGVALRRTVQAALAERPDELVVVDNASVDGCADFVAELSAAAAPTRVQLHRLARNVGFAAACNLGTAASQAPYVLFLNDDATLRPGYLATLCQVLHARADAASAIGKVIYVQHGQQRIDSAGIALVRYALRPQDRGQDELDVGQYDQAEEIFGPTGAAALYRRTALQQAGGFDASLFAYYEDVDLAWRLGRAHWRHLYEPCATVEHRRRGPTNKPLNVEAQAWLNRYRVWIANEPAASFCRYGALALAWETARLLRLARRRPRLARAIARGAAPALLQALTRKRSDPR